VTAAQILLGNSRCLMFVVYALAKGFKTLLNIICLFRKIKI
jgi:hypothetical protein